MGKVEESITEKLEKAFSPTFLRVTNQSAAHAGHAGDDGSGESHFHVEMTAKAFEGKNRVERQRMVHAVLAEELAGTIHALSLKLSDA